MIPADQNMGFETSSFLLSVQQKLLWDNNPEHTNQIVLRVDKRHNANVVKQALHTIWQRHSALAHEYKVLPGYKYPHQQLLNEVCSQTHFSWTEKNITSAELDNEGVLTQYVSEAACWLNVSTDNETQESYLLLSVKALCCDIPSVLLLVKELDYALNSQPLDTLDADYEQFVNWQVSCLDEDDENYQQAQLLWQAKQESSAAALKEARHVDSLSSVDNLASQVSLGIHSASIKVPDQLTAALLNWVDSKQLALKIPLLAAAQLVLHTLSESENITVNHKFACRPFEELDTLIGCLERSVPMQSQLFENDSFDVLCKRIERSRETLNDNVEYYPHIHKKTEPVLADIGYYDQLSDAQLRSLTVLNIDGQLHKTPTRQNAHSPLAISFIELLDESGTQIVIHVESKPHLYSSDTTHTLLKRIQIVLEQAMVKPTQLISDITLRIPTDDRLLAESQGITKNNHDFNLINQFTLYAEQHPERPAITDEEETLSYQQVNIFSNHIAEQLKSYLNTDQAEPTLIPVYMTRSVWSVVSMLACLKAGATFVPLEAEDITKNNQTISARSAHLLALINPAVILTDGQHNTVLKEAGYNTLAIDTKNEININKPIKTIISQSDRLAYVIYTSGTTGEPKGVKVTTENLNNYCDSLFTNIPGMRDTHIVANQQQCHLACVSTLAADLGYTVVFGALASGGCLHLMRYSTITDDKAFADYLQEKQIDLVKMVPSHLQALLNNAEITGTPAQHLLPSIALILGGETFSLSQYKTISALKETHQLNCKIFNHYGPSETTIGCFMLDTDLLVSSRAADTSSVNFSASVPIGRPLLNTGFKIVDTNGRDVLPLMAGELVVLGAGVTAGYINASEKEQQRFTQIATPAGQVSAFYTRDRVRLLPDGCIEFLGRVDDQVKLRGYRVELEAIVHKILQHPAIKQACVSLHNPSSGNGEPRLVAWYVENKNNYQDTSGQIYKGYAHADNEASIESAAKGIENEVLAHLSTHLPDYMLPTQWVGLQRLPLTLNGKVDLKALPDADELLTKEKIWLPPQTSSEKQLATIWTELLKIEKCGLNDHFFQLGGNSLLATQVVARLRKISGQDIAIADFFDHPILKDQAAYLAELMATPPLKSDEHALLPQLQVVDPKRMYPLSFSQQRLWFLDQLNPQSSLYNVPAAIRFNGILDEQKVINALNNVWRCHDGLRTRIHHMQTEAQTRPEQTISDDVLEIKITNLDQENETSLQFRQEKADKLCRDEANTAFNLHQDPLMRAHLIKISEDESLLLVTLHHIVSDAWSTDLLLQDFTKSYQGQSLERPAFSSLDFSHWQHQYFTAEQERKELDFWKKALHGAQQYISLPLDRKRPEYQTWRGARSHQHIDKRVIDALDSIASDGKYSRFMLLMTAFKLMLNKQTGMDDLCVTLPVAGRNPNGAGQGIENTIGLFLNSLVLRTQLNHTATIRQLAEQIRGSLLGAFDHQSLPFDRLIRQLPINRATGYTAYNQVCFNLLNTPVGKSIEAINGDELSAKLEISDTCTAKYDMEWILCEQDGAIDLCVEYNPDLFDSETIELMITEFYDFITLLPTQFDHYWQQPDFVLTQTQATLLQYRQQAISSLSAASFAVREPYLTLEALSASNQWILTDEQTQWIKNHCLNNHLNEQKWLSALAALCVTCFLQGQDDFIVGLGHIELLISPTWLTQCQSVTALLQSITRQAELITTLSATLSTADSALSVLVIEPARGDEHVRCLAISLAPQFTLTLTDKEQMLPGILSVMNNVLQQLMADSALTTTKMQWLSEPQMLTITTDMAGAQPKVVDELNNPLLSALETGLLRNPDGIAVRDGEGSISYQALHIEANKLAHLLLSYKQSNHNENTTPCVAILAQPGRRWMIMMLATIKAGYMYLPLDGQLPQDRILKILQDADCQNVWYDTCFIKQIEGLQNEAFNADVSIHAFLDLARAAQQQSSIAPTLTEVINHTQQVIDDSFQYLGLSNRALYAIYTSGSTGEPKGAMVSHANVRNLLDWYVDEYQINSDDRVLIISSLAFDLTQKNLFATLCAGGELVFPAMQYFDADLIAQSITRWNITLLNCAPSAFYSVLAVCQQSTSNDDAYRVNTLNSLRYLLLGGESIDLSRLYSWLSNDDCNTRLVNMYGPTECTDIACAYTLNKDDLNAHEDMSAMTLPIGFPNAGVQLFILDEQQRLLPPGLMGELGIAGQGVGKGYINRPEQTANAFVRRPLLTHDILYRTGDIAYVNDAGACIFSGRRDHQVKHRGFRIELSGIRSTILQQNLVVEAAVLLSSNEQQITQLVAVIQPYSSTEATDEQALINELKGSIEAQLPAYMLPEHWVVVSDMPLNRNGKLDLSALAKSISVDSSRQIGRAPHSERERWLANLWQSLLLLDDISAEDDFFMLGGHSLIATQLVSRMRKETGLSIPLTLIFEHTTLASMASAIDNIQNQAGVDVNQSTVALKSVVNLIENEGSEGRYPLSYAQQRLWFMQSLDLQSHNYNMSSVLKVSGPINQVALDKACRALMRRHATLRTRFIQDIDAENGVYQQIEAVPQQFLTTHLVSKLFTEEVDFLNHADSLIKQTTDRAFDLTCSPVWRATCITAHIALHVLVVTLHHIAADGWSMAILIRELMFFYEKEANQHIDHATDLPALPLQYADYANWQRESLQGSWLQQLVDFWQQQLAGAPPVMLLASDRPRSAHSSNVGARLNCEISTQLSNQLHALATQQGVTLYMVLMAAFNVVLHGHTRQTDLIVGTDLANRSRHELENLIGFFVNVLPIRVKLNSNPGFNQILHRVKATMLGVYEHQDLPFDKLVEVINPPRDPSYHPIFQTLFVLQNTPVERLNKGEIVIDVLVQQHEQTRFDLALLLEESNTTDDTEHLAQGRAISGHWSFNTAMFDVETIDKLNQSLLNVLQAAVTDSSLPLNQLLSQSRGSATQRRQKRQSRASGLRGMGKSKNTTESLQDSLLNV